MQRTKALLLVCSLVLFACAPGRPSSDVEDSVHATEGLEGEPLASLSGTDENDRLLLGADGRRIHVGWTSPTSLTIRTDELTGPQALGGGRILFFNYTPARLGPLRRDAAMVQRGSDPTLHFAVATQEWNGPSVSYGTIADGVVAHTKVSSPDPTAKLVQKPQVTVGADGHAHIVWTSEGPSRVTSIWAAECDGIGACTAGIVDTIAAKDSVVVAIAAEGNGVVLGVGITRALNTFDAPVEPSTARFYRKTSGVWAPPESIDTGLTAIRSLRVIAGFDRLVAVVGARDSELHDLTFALERTGESWDELVRLPFVGSSEARLTRDHGLVVFASRCFRRQQTVPVHCDRALWRLYREDEGFRSRALEPEVGFTISGRPFLDTHAIGPDGRGYEYDDGRSLRRWSARPHEGEFAPFSEPADPGARGAGSLAHGEPCLQSHDLSDTVRPKQWMLSGTLKGATTGAFHIPGGTCIVDATIGGSDIWRVKLMGTPDRPVQLLHSAVGGGKTQVFVERTFATKSFIGGNLTMTHTSMAGGRISQSLRPITEPIVPSSDDPSSLPARLVSTVRDSRFLSLGPRSFGDDSAFIESRGFDDLTIERCDFVGFDRVLHMNHDGFNQASLTVTDVTMEDVGLGLDVGEPAFRSMAYLQERYPLTIEAVGTATLPVRVRKLVYRGRQPDPNVEATPALRFSRVAGSVADSTIAFATSDGIELDNPGLFEVRRTQISDNGRHGVFVVSDVPTDLGRCVQPQGGEAHGEVVIAPWSWYNLDPIVQSCTIERNGGSGIEVDLPHVPMTVRENLISDNAHEGFAIRHGRGFSDGGWNEEGLCTHQDEHVDVPLSPDTVVEHNVFSGNGASAGGVQLFSDHRLGTLPASSNCWGDATPDLDTEVSCTTSCDVTPPDDCSDQP